MEDKKQLLRKKIEERYGLYYEDRKCFVINDEDTISWSNFLNIFGYKHKDKSLRSLDDFFNWDKLKIENCLKEWDIHLKDELEKETIFNQWKEKITPFTSDNKTENQVIVDDLYLDASTASKLVNGNSSIDAYRRSIRMIERLNHIDTLEKNQKGYQDKQEEIERISTKVDELNQENSELRKKNSKKIFLITFASLLLIGALFFTRLQKQIGELTADIKAKESNLTKLKTDTIEFKKNLSDLEKKYEQLQLWSTIQNEGDLDKSEGLRKKYDAIISPIRHLLDEGKFINGIKDNLIVNGERPPIHIDELKNKWHNLIIRTHTYEGHTLAYGKFEYFLWQGTCSYSPEKSDQQNQDLIRNKFAGINSHLETLAQGYRSEMPECLEHALEKHLGLDKIPDKIIRPVLFFTLYFPKGNIDNEAYMYRYPSYIKDCIEAEEDYKEPYKNYHHSNRPFYLDLKHGRALKLKDVEKGDPMNVYLSSIYSDFGPKTIAPIRTLIFEIEQQGERFLFCIDFKFTG